MLIIWLSIIIVFLIYNTIELQKFRPVGILNFSENEWIKVNNALIFSYPGPVSPNQQLELSMNVTNKQNYSLMFEPEIYVSIGGNPPKSPEHLQYSQSGPRVTRNLLPNYFFLADAGPNQITVKLKTSFMNGTFIGYENATTTIDVLSISDKLQLEQNYITTAGVIFSGLIGVVTTIALIKSHKTAKEEVQTFKEEVRLINTQNTLLETNSTESKIQAQEQNTLLRNQNDMFKEQASIQNRPWISLISEHPTSHVSDIFQIQFKNYGKTVAIGVIIKSWIKDGDMTIQEVEQHGTTYAEVDVSPNETFSHIIPIPSSLSGKVNGSNDIHIGIIMKYKYEIIKQGESILIGYWNPSFKKLHYKIKKLE